MLGVDVLKAFLVEYKVVLVAVMLQDIAEGWCSTEEYFYASLSVIAYVFKDLRKKVK